MNEKINLWLFYSNNRVLRSTHSSTVHYFISFTYNIVIIIVIVLFCYCCCFVGFNTSIFIHICSVLHCVQRILNSSAILFVHRVKQTSAIAYVYNLKYCVKHIRFVLYPFSVIFLAFHNQHHKYTQKIHRQLNG